MAQYKYMIYCSVFRFWSTHREISIRESGHKVGLIDRERETNFVTLQLCAQRLGLRKDSVAWCIEHRRELDL